jgi:uncharacterized beta-barrel protein YwiB (DUF1934 family)
MEKAMFKEEIRIKIRSELYEVEESLFSDPQEDEDDMASAIAEAVSSNGEGELDVLEINTLGEMTVDNGRVTFSYEETESTGMEGSVTALTYLESTPDIVSMIREGAVSATLVFEEGKRHHCIYNTPIMPFEICVRTKKVVNRLSINGTLELDYIIEIRGAKAERTRFYMQVLR